jgi:type III secretion protein T
MPFETLFSSLRDLELYAVAGAFALARLTGLMAIMPFFSRIRLAGLLRNGVALAFAIPIIPALVDVLRESHMTTTVIMAYMLKEFVVGLMLGLVMGVPFWAAEAAGDILDLQRGSSMGTLIDPMMTHETSATGTLLTIVMMTIYLAAGGLEVTLSSLYDSYSLWPVDNLLPALSKEAAAIFLELLDRTISMALALVFPLIVSLLLSDVVLALLARASPHLNVFALSLIVKTLVFSMVFPLYATFLVQYIARDLGVLLDTTTKIREIGCCSP